MMSIFPFETKVIPLNNVVVGSGTWIGRNACIMGCKIGRNCVIGAFSFVKKTFLTIVWLWEILPA